MIRASEAGALAAVAAGCMCHRRNLAVVWLARALVVAVLATATAGAGWAGVRLIAAAAQTTLDVRPPELARVCDA